MNKTPGFIVGKPRSDLLSEIDSSLEKAFADFHQQVCETVRKFVSAASTDKIQTYLAHDQATPLEAGAPKLPALNENFWCSPGLRASLGEHLPPRVWDNLIEKGPSRELEPKWRLPLMDMKFSQGIQDPQDCKLIPLEMIQNDAIERHISLPGKKQREKEMAPCSTTGSRRTNASSVKHLASLRTELDDWDDDKPSASASWIRKINLKQVFGCQCKTNFDRIEPRDLHFDQLAAREGKLWKDLSLKEQINIISEELTRSTCLLDPFSDTMKAWDCLVIFCVIFTAVVVPYEISFLEIGYGALYIINHAIDLVFIVDMVLQFFLKVRIQTRQRSTWVRSQKKIAVKYLKSWFVVDFLSVIPWDDIRNAAESQKSSLHHLKIMRLLRVLRLLKLLRMLKASRLAKRWENRNGLPSSTKHLLKCFFLILASIHWMGCLWGFIGRWEGSNLKCRDTMSDNDPLLLGSPTASWYVDVDAEWAPNDPPAWSGMSWVVAFAQGRAENRPIDPCDHSSLYVVSFYWAVMTMTSIGYGDILPQTFAEYIVNSILMVLSGIIWAYIIGVASSVLSNSYPEVTEFENRMDAFNAMVKDMHVPTKMRLRGREFIREARLKASHERNLKVIHELGFDLQTHLSKQSGKLYFNKIKLFIGCSELFCADCASHMVPRFFEPHYVAQPAQPDGHLCVVEKGAMGYEGHVLVPFNCWGEDFIVADFRLRSQSVAVALNYTLVVSLSSSSLEAVLINHPEERQHFARRAVCMAFLGAVRIYFNEIETEEHLPDNRWIHRLLTRKMQVPQVSLLKPAVSPELVSLAKCDQIHTRNGLFSSESTTNPDQSALLLDRSEF